MTTRQGRRPEGDSYLLVREPSYPMPFVFEWQHVKGGEVLQHETTTTKLPLQITTSDGTVLTVRCMERVEGRNKVLSQLIYLDDTPPEDDDDYYGKVPGVLLASNVWHKFGDWNTRIQPVIESSKVDWIKEPTPDQVTWNHLKTKYKHILSRYPEIAFVMRSGPVSAITDRFYTVMEAKYGIDQCGDCQHFDADTGREEFLKITHHFDGGETAQMNKDVAQIVAQERGLPNLKDDNVGLCTVRASFIETTTQACPEFTRCHNLRK